MQNKCSRIIWSLTVALTISIFGSVTAFAQTEPPRPVTDFTATDRPLDKGDDIELEWTLSLDDIQLSDEQLEQNKNLPEEDQIKKLVSHYKVLRSTEANGKFVQVARVEPSKWEYKSRSVRLNVPKCEREEDYYFMVYAVGPSDIESKRAGPIGPVHSTRQLFDGHPFRKGGRFWLMLITLILCCAVIFWIRHARQGKPIKIRKIAGLEAVNEAVGRATEMGRSVMFIPGIQDMNDIQTIAGLTCLSSVAKTAAEYDAKIEVPTSRALVMTAAQETVQSAFLAAGKPDAYNEDLIYYVTDEQFGYVAYLQGMMVREKPAACFYMGAFFAESLILAETGNSIGAIQIAGTAMPAQLPFFVAACDYTLIGEEFFAASAYLSGSAEELGSLKGQDVGKVVVALGLIVGAVFATLAALSESDTDMFEFLTEFIKDIVMT